MGGNEVTIDIELEGQTYKIKAKVKWDVMEKVVTNMQQQDLGKLFTNIVVGQCISPRYTYASIKKEDGILISVLGSEIMRKLDITEERLAGLKKKEDPQSD